MYISKPVIAAILVAVAVLLGGVVFAVSGDGEGDRTAAIGAQGQPSAEDAVRGQYEASAAAADSAERDKPASEKKPGAPPGQLKAVEAKLGKERSAGTYFDPETEKWVVTVLDNDAAAAADVRREGGQPKFVKHSAAKLDATERNLKPEVAVDGVAYGVDTVSNRVLISVDSTVPAANRAKIAAAVQATSGAAALEELPGKIDLRLGTCTSPKADDGGHEYPHAGRAITLIPTSGTQSCVARCSQGFNLTGGHYLSAGHCDPSRNGSFDTGLGVYTPAKTIAVSYPTNDYALMRYDSPSSAPVANGFVKLYRYDPNGGYRLTQRIESAGDAYVGQAVQKSGWASKVSRGSVTALEQTVTVGGQTVSGLIRTNLCSLPYDSGGPLFAGTIALGILTSGVGSCTMSTDACGYRASTGTGPTYFQPVKEALTDYASKYGVALKVG